MFERELNERTIRHRVNWRETFEKVLMVVVGRWMEMDKERKEGRNEIIR